MKKIVRGLVVLQLLKRVHIGMVSLIYVSMLLLLFFFFFLRARFDESPNFLRNLDWFQVSSVIDFKNVDCCFCLSTVYLRKSCSKDSCNYL